MGDEEQSGLLSNFLFGNIDEDGRLETDFIDLALYKSYLFHDSTF